MDSAEFFAETPVGDLSVNKLWIRYQNIDIIARSDTGITQADFLNNTGSGVGNLDKVTDFQRFFQDEDNAGNKITDNILQTKANADAYCTTDKSQTGQIKPDIR